VATLIARHAFQCPVVGLSSVRVPLACGLAGGWLVAT
jgi:hypothetical protein